MTLLVDEALMPSLSSFFPSDKPAVPFGTMNALMPLCFLALSVVANTTKPSACQLLVIQDLVPFNNQPPASFLAVVEAAPASLPEKDKFGGGYLSQLSMKNLACK